MVTVLIGLVLLGFLVHNTLSLVYSRPNAITWLANNPKLKKIVMSGGCLTMGISLGGSFVLSFVLGWKFALAYFSLMILAVVGVTAQKKFHMPPFLATLYVWVKNLLTVIVTGMLVFYLGKSFGWW